MSDIRHCGRRDEDADALLWPQLCGAFFYVSEEFSQLLLLVFD